MHWNEAEIREIKLEMKNRKVDLAEKLSRRIGVDTTSIKEKIREIEAKNKIKRMASGIKDELKKHRGRRFRKYGRKFKGWVKN